MIGATGTFTSCKDYDDDIKNLQEQIDGQNGLSAKITAVESSISNLQSAQSGLQSEIAAAKNEASKAALAAQEAAIAAAKAELEKVKAELQEADKAGIAAIEESWLKFQVESRLWSSSRLLLKRHWKIGCSRCSFAEQHHCLES